MIAGSALCGAPGLVLGLAFGRRRNPTPLFKGAGESRSLISHKAIFHLRIDRGYDSNDLAFGIPAALSSILRDISLPMLYVVPHSNSTTGPSKPLIKIAERFRTAESG